MSKPLANNSVMPQVLVFSSYLIFMCISDLSVRFSCHLVRCAVDDTLRRAVSGSEDILSYSNSWSFVYVFPLQAI